MEHVDVKAVGCGLNETKLSDLLLDDARRESTERVGWWRVNLMSLINFTLPIRYGRDINACTLFTLQDTPLERPSIGYCQLAKGSGSNGSNLLGAQS